MRFINDYFLVLIVSVASVGVYVCGDSGDDSGAAAAEDDDVDGVISLRLVCEVMLGKNLMVFTAKGDGNV